VTLILILPLLIQGCEKKDNSQELKDQEMRLLQQYLVDNNVTQEPTASGLYYIENEEGTGHSPKLEFFIDIEYTTQLIDGTVIGTSNEALAKEKDLYRESSFYGPIRLFVGYTGVPGLDEGIVMMLEGGKADLIMPSDINGMGGNSSSLSPAYSTHIYNIELINTFDEPEIFQENQIVDFLVEHEIDSVNVTNTGLHYIEKMAGSGDLIQTGDVVEVKYTGSFLDGRIFDSNMDGDALIVDMPAIPNFIKAWDEALRLMKQGTEARIIVPYEEAYGAEGRGPIPPFMTLVFDMVVLKVTN